MIHSYSKEGMLEGSGNDAVVNGSRKHSADIA